MDNFDTALNRAQAQTKNTIEYKIGLLTFNKWLYNHYKIVARPRTRAAEVVDHGVVIEDQKWDVVSIDDDGLAIMFKLKYG